MNKCMIAPARTRSEKRNRGGFKFTGEFGKFGEKVELFGNPMELVRGELLDTGRKAKVTITNKNFKFNTECVNLFKGCQLVSVRVDKVDKLLIVTPAASYDQHPLKFAQHKEGKIVPRTCASRLCQELFDFMNWDENTKYRILAGFEEYECGFMRIVFNLADANWLEANCGVS